MAGQRPKIERGNRRGRGLSCKGHKTTLSGLPQAAVQMAAVFPDPAMFRQCGNVNLFIASAIAQAFESRPLRSDIGSIRPVALRQETDRKPWQARSSQVRSIRTDRTHFPVLFRRGAATSAFPRLDRARRKKHRDLPDTSHVLPARLNTRKNKRRSPPLCRRDRISRLSKANARQIAKT